MAREQAIKDFAALVQEDQRVECQRKFPDVWNTVLKIDWQVKVKPGRRYVKVDVGCSGKFMIDAEGRIFGIKGYGVIHRGHQYGTLDTTNKYNWGGYTPVLKGGKP